VRLPPVVRFPETDGMAKAKPAPDIAPERLARYDRLIATQPGLQRKGATIPYTSVNGHMCSFLAYVAAHKLKPTRREG
jgi:hypothetical protein